MVKIAANDILRTGQFELQILVKVSGTLKEMTVILHRPKLTIRCYIFLLNGSLVWSACVLGGVNGTVTGYHICCRERTPPLGRLPALAATAAISSWPKDEH